MVLWNVNVVVDKQLVRVSNTYQGIILKTLKEPKNIVEKLVRLKKEYGGKSERECLLVLRTLTIMVMFVSKLKKVLGNGKKNIYWLWRNILDKLYCLMKACITSMEYGMIIDWKTYSYAEVKVSISR